MVPVGDEPVDHDAAVLADAVGAVDGLRLGGRVPPRVEQEHVVGLGQGETEPARLEADEEHRRFSPAERLDGGVAVARRAVEVGVRDAALFEPAARDRGTT